jgi:hypothetical protein
MIDNEYTFSSDGTLDFSVELWMRYACVRERIDLQFTLSASYIVSHFLRLAMFTLVVRWVHTRCTLGSTIGVTTA